MNQNEKVGETEELAGDNSGRGRTFLKAVAVMAVSVILGVSVFYSIIGYETYTSCFLEKSHYIRAEKDLKFCTEYILDEVKNCLGEADFYENSICIDKNGDLTCTKKDGTEIKKNIVLSEEFIKRGYNIRDVMELNDFRYSGSLCLKTVEIINNEIWFDFEGILYTAKVSLVKALDSDRRPEGKKENKICYKVTDGWYNAIDRHNQKGHIRGDFAEAVEKEEEKLNKLADYIYGLYLDMGDIPDYGCCYLRYSSGEYGRGRRVEYSDTYAESEYRITMPPELEKTFSELSVLDYPITFIQSGNNEVWFSLNNSYGCYLVKSYDYRRPALRKIMLRDQNKKYYSNIKALGNNWFFVFF